MILLFLSLSEFLDSAPSLEVLYSLVQSTHAPFCMILVQYGNLLQEQFIKELPYNTEVRCSVYIVMSIILFRFFKIVRTLKKVLILYYNLFLNFQI